ncbi:MAG: hypothetical protein HY900_21215 [Deltaproteobacteria bacterium]|nr:hypothetical protein [Deltaproteobacteria bacterium]
MATVEWLTCPDCSRRFYVEAEQIGRNVRWLCPFCKRIGPENEFAIVPGGRNLNNETTVMSVTKEVPTAT